jgi:hypothetical protein
VTNLQLSRAVEFHAFAPLEALACVWTLTSLSRCWFLTDWCFDLCHNTAGASLMQGCGKAKHELCRCTDDVTQRCRRKAEGRGCSEVRGVQCSVLAMDSAVLGLASPLMVDVEGSVLGFGHGFCRVRVSITSYGGCRRLGARF